MGKRVLAAFGVAAPLAATSATAVPSRRQAGVLERTAVQIRVGADKRARTDVAPLVGHERVFAQAPLKAYGLGRFPNDRAALRRDKNRIGRDKDRLRLRLGDARGADSSDPTPSASPGSRRTPRREAISPTITLHPRKHA